ncbi:MAG: hypothetical protein AMJ63_17685, partial [Myxococcales bacterium SG8_38_1]
GSPDACTGCHRGKTAQWAERQIDKHFDKRSSHAFAETFHAARNQRPEGEPGLVELVAAGKAPAIVRATALLELRNLGSSALPALLMRAEHDESAVVRRSIAVAARDLPQEQRVEVVRPLLRDDARTVRVEAVATLLGSDARSWRKVDQIALKKATTEYLEARSISRTSRRSPATSNMPRTISAKRFRSIRPSPRRTSIWPTSFEASSATKTPKRFCVGA